MYIHIKYMIHGSFEMLSEYTDRCAFIGFYADSVEEDSTEIKDYQWRKIGKREFETLMDEYERNSLKEGPPASIKEFIGQLYNRDIRGPQGPIGVSAGPGLAAPPRSF